LVDKKRNVVILDVPTWYVPVIERQELAKAGAEVVVGWAKTAGAPPEASMHYPPAEIGTERYSTITCPFVPPSLFHEDLLIEMAQDADAVMVVKAKITARVMESLPRLRVVGRYGIGVDNVDVEAATRLGVAVVNVPGCFAREVADHTMMFLLAFGRKLPQLDRLMKQGVWGRPTVTPIPAFYGQTLGLIAFGEIGREVALRAKPFGIKVLAYDPFVDPKAAASLGVDLVGLDELLARSDYVSVHAPLNAKTRHMLSDRELRLMKPTAYLFNTARGPVVDEAALVRALQQKLIAGAGLDVYETEPLYDGSPLRELPNVLLTPHTAGISDESQVEARRRLSRSIAAILEGGWPEGRDLNNPDVKQKARGGRG